ncbi:Aste57867_5070 [Aphanomyces stellatus]|uniref:Aste57867_5070 protein n=1 Tax=Aphanomyces stellatus TaxID=120398 RepID=A0A485KGC5_9STRA|nr:hypothetical protein As57867_005057 [Aphanomyces stellatus]VFT82151.1 Aste57867_5070 [Aphanomyces stellatus]
MWAGTSVASDASNVNSRSFTILHALERLDLLHAKNHALKRKHKLPDEVDPPVRLVLHIVGADFREGNDVAETLRAFDQLITAFHTAPPPTAKGKPTPDHGYDELVLVMIGPNVARKLHGVEERVVFPSSSSSSGGKSVRLLYATELWEEYLAGPRYLSPSAVFCFNAGVWGYDEWLPTFQHMMCEDAALPILVTSYNEFEAVDDADAIDDMEGPWVWRWQQEPNPFASLTPRSSQNTIANRVLHENAYWQCFSMQK